MEEKSAQHRLIQKSMAEIGATAKATLGMGLQVQFTQNEVVIRGGEKTQGRKIKERRIW